MTFTGVFFLTLYEINDFMGLDNEVFKASSKCGADMDNFRIVKGKLTTRNGFRALAFLGSFENLQGAVFGNVAYSEPLLYYVADNVLFSLDISTGEIITIGNLENFYAYSKMLLFFWGEILYIITGSQYYKYTYAGLSVVTGHVPTLKTDVLPDGTGGAFLKDKNLLTNSAIMEFKGDGASTVYKVYEGSISVSDITINGLPASGYTVNSSEGTVTFSTAPAANSKVCIRFSALAYNKRGLVTGCVCGTIFCGTKDFDIFLYGNLSYPYMRINSEEGNPEYFPESGICNIGSRRYPITGIVPFYDRQIILTKKGIYYSVTEKSGGKVQFPVYPLSENAGCKIEGSAHIVGNRPVFIDSDVCEILSTNIRDERNIREIGKKILPFGIENAVTCSNPLTGEYFVSLSDITYVYSSTEDKWYRFSGFTPKLYLNIEERLYFINSENILCRFEDDLFCDYNAVGSGVLTPISAFFEMPFYDFGNKISYKFTDRLYIGLLPSSKTSLLLCLYNEKGNEISRSEIENLSFDFSDLDFSAFSFEPVLRKKPFVVRMKSRGYSEIRLKLSCATEKAPCTVLSVTIPANIAGKIR